jgi:hypothetical protein
MITLDQLKEQLKYLPSSGKFMWIIDKKGSVKGSAAGSVVGDFIQIGIKRRSYQAHRLAWLWHYGEYPLKTLIHIDGDKKNNRIENLKESDKLSNYVAKNI